jgi:hypothetical protein
VLPKHWKFLLLPNIHTSQRKDFKNKTKQNKTKPLRFQKEFLLISGDVEQEDIERLIAHPQEIGRPQAQHLATQHLWLGCT